MKKIIFLIQAFCMLIVFLIDCFTVAEASQAVGDDPLSHNQWYLIPDNAGNGDDVGFFHINVTDSVFNAVSGYDFTIVSGNSAGIFTINSSGLITINDNTVLLPGNYKLGIEIIEGTRRDTNYAFIECTSNADNVFIDFNYSGIEAGTRAQPFNNLREDIGKEAGYIRGKNYYLKRAAISSINDGIFVNSNHLGAGYIRFAAYGQGAKPIIKGGGSPVDQRGILVGPGFNPAELGDTVARVHFYDIKVDSFERGSNGGGRNIDIGYYVSHCKFYRIESANSGRESFYIRAQASPEYFDNIIKTKHALYDCYATYGDMHNYKEGGADTLISCYSYNANYNGSGGGHGFSLNGQAGKILKYCYAALSGGAGFECSVDSLDLEYVLTDNHYYGLYFNWDETVSKNPDYGRVNHFISKSARTDLGSRAIYINDTSSDIKFTNGYILNSRRQGIYIREKAHDISFSRIVFDSVTGPALIMRHNVSDIILDYALVTNCGSIVELYNEVENVKIHHLSSYNNGTTDFMNASTHTHELANSIYNGISGNWNSISNFDFNGGDPYTNSGGNDFTLSSDTLGSDLDYVYDIRQYKIVGIPSIGAFEYRSDPDKPIARWKFEENGLDASGNGFDADIYGSVTYPEGADGKAISLYGSDRYVDCGAIKLGDKFTITGWYKLGATYNVRTLVSNASSSYPDGFNLYLNASNGEFAFQTGNGTSATLTASSTTGNHTPGEWVHFAVVVDKTNGTCNFYIDADDVTGSDEIRTDFGTNSDIYLGRTTNNQYKLYGYMDDVRIYDYKLNTDEIDELVNGPTLPNISVTAQDAYEEGEAAGKYTITRDITGEALTIYYSTDGTASNVDYDEELTGSVSFNVFESTVELSVTPVDDNLAEENETLILTLTVDSDYIIGTPATDTVFIFDNEPVLIISVTDAEASESGQDEGEFTISRGENTTGDLTVSYSVGGTASSEDYLETLNGTVVIYSGHSSADIVITPVDDPIIEDDETVILCIEPHAGYHIGIDTCATITIEENDEFTPIAHWKFEGNGLDASGNGYDATIYGNVYYPTGADGLGISLLASDRYVDCGTINLGSAFTITGWYKLSATYNVRTLVSNASSSYPDGFNLYLNASNGQFTFQTGNGTVSTISASSTTGNHTPGEWVHFAVVVDKTNGTCDFYIDADNVTCSDQIRTDLGTNSDIYLGRTTNNQHKLYGYLDDVRIYNVLLSESEISAVYNLLAKSGGNIPSKPETENSVITMYPLPVKDNVYINNLNSVVRIELINLTGEVVEQFEINNVDEYIVELNEYKSGVYYIRFIKENESSEIRMIVKE